LVSLLALAVGVVLFVANVLLGRLLISCVHHVEHRRERFITAHHLQGDVRTSLVAPVLHPLAGGVNLLVLRGISLPEVVP